MKRFMLSCLAAWLAAALAARAAEPAAGLTHRWVYVSRNLLVDRNVAAVEKLVARAAKAGYTGVVLADSKFMRWDDLPEKYLVNVGRVRAACRRHKLDCIACVCPIGYSNSLLSRDPNLAAGLPVRGAPFVVRGGRLVPADESTVLRNGSFETFKGDRPGGWDWADKPGRISFIDRRVKAHGAASLRMQDIRRHHPTHGNGRVMQTLKVRPFRYWHVSAKVKTEGFTAAGEFRVAVLAAGGAALNHYQPRIRPTQDWTRIDVTFNSLDFEEVRLYLGVWGGGAGKIWFDDVRLAPGGLVNLIRRDGAPVKMTSSDGKTQYAEGRDVAPVRDPLTGNVRYRGNFDVWHARPVVKVLPGGRLAEGGRVLLSYCHAALIHSGQVCCCMSEPKVYEIIKWQIDRVRKHLRPDGYFMQHDEIRVAGWDAACAARKLTCGQVLADNVRRCTAIIRKADPGKPIYVWSDMFDPHHNARKAGRYYLVKGDGPWHGSWEGLEKDVVVVNWHNHQPGRAQSLRHFAGRGHRQVLAGYYDAPVGRIAEWLAEARRVKGVVGVMYTTWRRNYDDLEAFAAEVRKAAR